jgi:hypothetical protein
MSTGKCGWVLKEGEKVTNWKKRYLCIEQDQSRMSYYIKDNKKEKKGEILLKTIKDVRAEREYKGRKLVFGIHTTVGRIYYIQGSDDENVASWVNAIKEAINPTKPQPTQQTLPLNSNPKVALLSVNNQPQQAQPQPQPQPQQPAQQAVKQYTEDDFIQLKVIGRGGFGKVLLVKKKDDGRVCFILHFVTQLLTLRFSR